MKSQATTLARHDTLEELPMTESFNGVEERFGNAIYHWHRVDLHQTLRDYATASAAHPNPPASVHLGARIKAIDCDEGIIVFENGQQVRKDLLVIADGHKVQFNPFAFCMMLTFLKSRFNHYFHPSGQHLPLMKSGRSAYRALVPYSAINAHPGLKPVFDTVPTGFYTPVDLSGARTYFVMYPCRNKTILNIAIMHPTHPKDAGKEDWHSPATVEDVFETIEGFSPLLHDLIKLSPEITVYSLASREPLPTLSRGRAVIVGDAAAIMQPHTAQGGTIAIEQAGALEVLFANASTKDPEEVARLAKDYDTVMRRRTHMVQLFSDARPMDETDPRRQKAGELSDRPLPDPMTMPFTESVREFLYHFNVLQEARKFVQSKGVGR